VTASPQTSRIVRGTTADVAELLPLLEVMHAEGAYAPIPLNRDKLRAYVSFCMQEPNHAAFVHRGGDGRIGGFLIGNVQPYPFSTELGAWDDYFYVRKDLRGRILAYRLYKAFRDWAASRGARYLWFGTTVSIDPERVDRFFRGLGHQENGRLYRLRLTPQGSGQVR
jgi:GNAT superfamily N-acetyltransferase